MPKGSERNRFMECEERERERHCVGVGHLLARLLLLSAVTGLCISLFGSACCVATSMLHNPIKFSLRLCYFKKQQQQRRKRCLICRAAFIDFFCLHTHTQAHSLAVYTLFLCLLPIPLCCHLHILEGGS